MTQTCSDGRLLARKRLEYTALAAELKPGDLPQSYLQLGFPSPHRGTVRPETLPGRV